MENPRDRRRIFGIHFGRSYFESPPLISPAFFIAFAVPSVLLLIILVALANPAAGAGLLFFTVAGDLETDIKAIKTEILGAVGNNAAKMAAMQRQLDALDIKLAERHGISGTGFGSECKLRELFEQSDQVKRLLHDKKGQAFITIPSLLLSRKTAITETAVGLATTGVMPLERIPGITPEARQRLFIRDLLTSRPTSQLLVDFVKVSSPMTKASPQTEASDKFENAVTFTSVSEKIRTIATWIPATKQILDDMSELMGFIRTALPYYVDLEEELQFLSGSGAGEDIHGLIPQATAFDTSLLSATAGYNKIDIIGRAIQQIAEAKEIDATFVVLNPRDWWAIRLTKDAFGRYILGDPMQPVNPANLFGLTPVPTTSIVAGTFLVGSGSPVAVEIRDRMETQVEISTSHSDFFIKNLLAVRVEKRVALCTKRPASFIYGASFTTSPAS